jgi:MYXO-CTERM domain-containing protein
MNHRILPLAALSAAFAATASAQLVHESFSGYSAGSINGQAALGTGLSGNWSAGRLAGTTGTLDATYTPTGLAFGSSFQSSGGALVLDISSATASNNAVVAGVSTAASLGTFAGTLYSSHLVQAAFTPNNSGTFGSRINTTIGGGGGTSRFQISGDAGTGTTTPGTDYIGNNTANGGNSLVSGQTFLVVGRFTAVGDSGGGTATQWVFSQAQYENWVAAGADEAALASRSVSTTADGIWARNNNTDATQANFVGGSSTFAQFFLLSGTTNAVSVTFDELRYGASLASVTPIPEPSAFAALAGLSALGLAASRRRRRG